MEELSVRFLLNWIFFHLFFRVFCSEAVGFQESNEKYDPEDGEGEDVLSSEFISSLSLELKRETTQIFPGSVFGLENYFSKHGAIQLDSIIVRFCSFHIFYFSLTRAQNVGIGNWNCGLFEL